MFTLAAPAILWITLAVFWLVASLLLFDMRGVALARPDLVLRPGNNTLAARWRSE